MQHPSIGFLSRTLASVSAVPFLLSLAACGVPVERDAHDAVGSEADALIGGHLAEAGEYTATVEIASTCTGAKVGPRHFLLAAHCVHDPNANAILPAFAPGASIRVTDAKVAEASAYRELTITETHVFPAWMSSCVAPCPLVILERSHPPDVALLVVAEETDSIREAWVDARPVAPGDPVIVSGYGCERGLYKDFGARVREHRIERSAAVAVGALRHDGSPISAANAPDVSASYVLTPGRVADPRAASLCFGDSGGPLYRDADGAGEQLVVGINAYYTFPQPFDGVSQTNWHTRLDANAPHDVFGWLAERGVRVRRDERPRGGAYERAARVGERTPVEVRAEFGAK